MSKQLRTSEEHRFRGLDDVQNSSGSRFSGSFNLFFCLYTQNCSLNLCEPCSVFLLYACVFIHYLKPVMLINPSTLNCVILSGKYPNCNFWQKNWQKPVNCFLWECKLFSGFIGASYGFYFCLNPKCRSCSPTTNIKTTSWITYCFY